MEQLLTITKTYELLSIGRTTFHRLIGDSNSGFPKPIILSGTKNQKRYRESEVDEWIKNQRRIN